MYVHVGPTEQVSVHGPRDCIMVAALYQSSPRYKHILVCKAHLFGAVHSHLIIFLVLISLNFQQKEKKKTSHGRILLQHFLYAYLIML